jgi:8-oxo-dGTP pyrophosphatase MutT (NUDIX family)
MEKENIKPKKIKKNKKVKAEARRRQVAALPFRYTASGSLEVLIITSRETRPKGWPMKGRADPEAAAIEAREEAGLEGNIHRKPIGKYSYWKRLADQFLLVEVDCRYRDSLRPGRRSNRARWLGFPSMMHPIWSMSRN